MFLLSDYDYDLPERLIAQQPADRRDRSKLLMLNRKTGAFSHHRFYHLSELLLPGDILVINNTKVIPTRLLGKRESGGKAEVLILDAANGLNQKDDQHKSLYQCLVKTSKHPKKGSYLLFDHGIRAQICDFSQGIFRLRFEGSEDLTGILDKIGKIPLPPYLKRTGDDQGRFNDARDYQTLFATHKGATAAPTAGLHFTKTLIQTLQSKGIALVAITLHVGYGTFSPVRVADIRNHTMHTEAYTISRHTADVVNKGKKSGRRIIAVGTTSVRALEDRCDRNGHLNHGPGQCDLFIYPGYEFKIVDGMMTNFHLPQSTLLMLISAFAGIESVRSAYREAINKNYRFYSYGDAMFITP